MKFRGKRVTCILTAALCAAMMLTPMASAYEEQSSVRTSTVGGVKYEYWASLYVDATNRYRAGTWITRADSAAIPSGTTVYARAVLYNEDGQILEESGPDEHDSGTSFGYSVTSTVRTTEAVYSQGEVSIEVGGDTLATLFTRATDTVGGSRSAALSADAVIENLESTMLEDDGSYPVTAAGETYGSGLLAGVTGEKPDLISAIGTDGVTGYVRAEDLDTVMEKGEERIVDLYDLAGNVIGEFVVRGSTTDYVPEVEATIQRLNAATAAAQAADQLTAMQTMVRTQTGGDNVVVMSENIEPKSIPNEYLTNDAGKTYGSLSWAGEIGYAPDLVMAVADNGVSGYVDYYELSHRTDESGDLIGYEMPGETGYMIRYIPVYDLEQENVLGEFSVSHRIR